MSSLARTGARTGTLGDADAAGCSFGEIGNAFVEVDILPLDARGVVSPNPSIDGMSETRKSARVSGCGVHVRRFGRRELEGSVIAGLTNRQDKERVAQSRWRRG